MLKRYYYDEKVFHFSDKDANFENNLFTVLVGKNGTGKSRLLSAIVSSFFDVNTLKDVYIDDERGIKKVVRLEFDQKPERIITASTSPFDKFPLPRRMRSIENYSYLGLRDLMSQNFGLAYMSKIIGALIDGIVENSTQMLEITNVLNYLGYTDKIRIKLELRLSSDLLKAVSESNFGIEGLMKFLEESRPFFQPVDRRFFYDENREFIKEKVVVFLEILKRLGLPGGRRLFNLEINKNGIIIDSNLFISSKDIIFLLHCGALRLRELNLQRIGNKTTYSLSDASSGEQCVVMGILGIASQIKHNSLICIDEPEICLHPEWQERYIKILMSTFNIYKGCHFIIATHSPQIISNLDPDNCYILYMESGEIINAKKVINNSVDFQLANVFNTPGYKNEYLTRIALNIFAKVGSKKMFDDDDLEKYNVLTRFDKTLDKEDPVYGLIQAIKKLFKLYA